MKSPVLIRILWCLAFFLVLVKVATVLLLEYKLPRLLRSTCTDNGWKLESVKVSAGWLGSDLSLKDLVVHEQAGQPRFFLFVPKLRLKGIHPFTLWFRDRLIIREIELSSPRLECAYSFQEDSVPLSMPIPIRIRKLACRNATMQLDEPDGNRQLRLSGTDVTLTNLKLAESEPLVTKALEQIQVASRQAAWQSADSLYHVAATGLTYDAGHQELAITSLVLRPNYSNYAFTARHKHQIDCIRGKIQGLVLKGFPVTEFQALGRVRCRHLSIQNMKLDVFRDRRKPNTRTHMPMVQEALYDVPLKGTVDTLSVAKGSISYTEHIKETDKTATVSFSEVTATFTGMTNDTLTTYKRITLDTRARLLGSAWLKCRIRAPLFDKSYTTYFQGSLSGMNGERFNDILERSAPVLIKSGILDTMQFEFELNKQASSGSMTMLYHDLDIGVNKAFSHTPVTWLQAFLMFLGSGKIQESNPRRGETRTGVIGFPRNPECSIFNYCLQSLLSGSQSTMTSKPSRKKDDEKNVQKSSSSTQTIRSYP